MRLLGQVENKTVKYGHEDRMTTKENKKLRQDCDHEQKKLTAKVIAH